MDINRINKTITTQMSDKTRANSKRHSNKSMT